MAPGAALHRCRHRAEHLHVGMRGLFQQLFGQRGGTVEEGLGLLALVGVGTQQGQMGERRQAGGAALAERLGGEGEVALLGELDQQRVVGQMGLDDHPPRRLGAAGTAGDLDDQLGHALAGAEVGGE
ncbi:hypothetical protein D3C78_1484530 [compost metagenome]